jgi:hypothetical protein
MPVPTSIRAHSWPPVYEIPAPEVKQAPLEWERRKAAITDDKGKVIFEQDNVEVPKTWSMLATNVVASKYFYGDTAHPNEREFSVRQLVHRVTRTIADWGCATATSPRRRTPRRSTTS